jgi:hypothetical protein
VLLAEQAPGMREAQEQAKTEGISHVTLDRTIIARRPVPREGPRRPRLGH